MSYWACVKTACEHTRRTGNGCYVVAIPGLHNNIYLATPNEDVVTHYVRNMGARVLLATGGPR